MRSFKAMTFETCSWTAMTEHIFYPSSTSLIIAISARSADMAAMLHIIAYSQILARIIVPSDQSTGNSITYREVYFSDVFYNGWTHACSRHKHPVNARM